MLHADHLIDKNKLIKKLKLNLGRSELEHWIILHSYKFDTQYYYTRQVRKLNPGGGSTTEVLELEHLFFSRNGLWPSYA